MINDKYKDIIDLPHYTSSKHPRMSMQNRAGQFAPFAALTGYSDAVRETARLTDERIELDEGIKLMLNDKLLYLESHSNIEVTFTYFVYDKRKKGGKYIDVVGVVKKIDKVNNVIILQDNKKLLINEIIKIKYML